jgi:hypothetical protein
MKNLYWRFPKWARWIGLFVVAVGAGLIIDLLSPAKHTVNIVFLVVVLSTAGVVAEAEKRHRRHNGG